MKEDIIGLCVDCPRPWQGGIESAMKVDGTLMDERKGEVNRGIRPSLQ